MALSENEVTESIGQMMIMKTAIWIYLEGLYLIFRNTHILHSHEGSMLHEIDSCDPFLVESFRMLNGFGFTTDVNINH